jgi:hypothetical protein
MDFLCSRTPQSTVGEMLGTRGQAMKMLAALVVALGMLLVAVAPAQAAHHATPHHQRHAHATHVKKAPSAYKKAPPAYVFADTVPIQAAPFCTYMGGPKSALWACH